MIAKADLVHGGYYHGHCRNASVARWDANKGQFLHWRNKFGNTFLEYISHEEDAQGFDTFCPDQLLPGGADLIPLEGE